MTLVRGNRPIIARRGSITFRIEAKAPTPQHTAHLGVGPDAVLLPLGAGRDQSAPRRSTV